MLFQMPNSKLAVFHSSPGFRLNLMASAAPTNDQNRYSEESGQRARVVRLFRGRFDGGGLASGILPMMLGVETTGKDRTAFGKLNTIFLRPGF